MSALDLYSAFTRARAPAENFQNESGAVDDLRVPGFFQIALLHRRDRAIHDDDGSFERFGEPGDLVDLALADISRRPRRLQHDDAALHDIEIDGAGKAHRLFQPRFRRARVGGRARAAVARRWMFDPRLNDKCAATLPTRWGEQIARVIALALFQLGPDPVHAFQALSGVSGSSPPSNN